MNTLGEHFDRAQQHLADSVQILATLDRVDRKAAEALLDRCRETAVAVRELLATVWGSDTAALRSLRDAVPQADRDTLAAMVKALDRRIGLHAHGRTDTSPPARAVAEATREVEAASGILRAHVTPDRTPRSPEATTLLEPGSRWMLSERVAAATAALAEVETGLASRWVNPHGPRPPERSLHLLFTARTVLRTPHETDPRVLSVHEAGHRPLRDQPLGDVAGRLERFCQRVWARAEAGDLDGISVRAAVTTGILATGHLEVIARSTQHRATELWIGVLGEIREQELRRVAADALTARQSWQQLQKEMQPLQPVGQPDVELTSQATQVRAALEAVTRRGDQWRPVEDLVRSRRDVEDLMRGIAQIARDAEALAAQLDRGLSTARSADLCIRADQITDPEAYVEERLRRKWVPAPPALLAGLSDTARRAEAANRTMAVSAAETRLSITGHQSLGQGLVSRRRTPTSSLHETASVATRRQERPRQV